VSDNLVLLPWLEWRTELPGELPDVDVRVYQGPYAPPDDVLARTAFYVLPYMGPAADLDLVARMPRLQVVQTLTAGVDHVLPRLPEGVTLCNARGVHDASTAELAVGLTLARLRRLDDMARSMTEGYWLHGRYDALADKRVVLVGYGSVGHAIAERLAPFEVDLVLVSHTERPGENPPVHGFGSLPALLHDADVVILAVPLTPETRGMVDAAFLGRMPDGALLVNVARGGVVVTDALLDELEEGRLRAALDVTDPEPLPSDHPLWRAPGLLVSPHVGGNTTAFLPRAKRLVADQLRAWTAGRPLSHVKAGPPR
jgi:phosphoglycerate dehydrogenase-like enzyme